LPCRKKKKKKLDDSSRLDVVEIARVPYMLPSLFPSWSGYGLISTPIKSKQLMLNKEIIAVFVSENRKST